MTVTFRKEYDRTRLTSLVKALLIRFAGSRCFFGRGDFSSIRFILIKRCISLLRNDAYPEKCMCTLQRGDSEAVASLQHGSAAHRFEKCDVLLNFLNDYNFFIVSP